METTTQTIDHKQLSYVKLDNDLMIETERDPSGRFLMEYLCRQIESREYWSEDDKLLVLESLELMYEAHGHDDRGNGDAYVTHPLRVAITLCANRASARLVAAALLHDSVEDAPEAAIRYITAEIAADEGRELIVYTEDIIASKPPREYLIEQAMELIIYSPKYAIVAPMVDGVTNRAYPAEIDTLPDPDIRRQAKHIHRASQIQQHIDASEDEAILKFADTYDNIRSLIRHEAFDTERNDIDFPERVRSLEKLLDKYTLMINTWKDLEKTRPTAISRDYIAICEERLREIAAWEPLHERRKALASTALKEVRGRVA